MTALKRALIASGALFATVFALLAAQLWFGKDPALGDATARVTSQKPEPELHASVLDTVISVASGLLDDEHGDDGEGDDASSSVRSGTS